MSGFVHRAPLGAGRAAPRGFSLIELMVVMVLVIGLMGLVGTSISRSVGAAELRNEVREVIAGLRHTRGQAVVQRAEKVFQVDADGLTWKAADRDSEKLPDGLDITLNTARSEMTGENAGGIRFYPDGSSTGGSIVLSVEERKWDGTVGWLTVEISQDPPEDA